MVEKITDDKYLYEGRIVDAAFLQDRIKELQEQIAANEQAIKEVKFIEIIPQIEAVPEYREAAEIYNGKAEEERRLLEMEQMEFNKIETELITVLK